MNRRPLITARARLKWDRREGRHLLLYPERGLALSETAAAILELCNGTRTLGDIAVEVARKYPDSDALTVQREVVTFLEELGRRGLIEMS
jgi:pyrroloquinoline quinone biosynthesis protein D